MAFDAIVNDYGDEIAMDLGGDITGWTLLTVTIQKPDGTTLTKTSAADGVTDKSAPTAGFIYYTVQSGVRSTDGEYRYSGTAFLPTKTIASVEYGEDVVGRVNQSVSEG